MFASAQTELQSGNGVTDCLRDVLVNRSVPHLVATFDQYRQVRV